jgi:hypothetical protein
MTGKILAYDRHMHVIIVTGISFRLDSSTSTARFQACQISKARWDVSDLDFATKEAHYNGHVRYQTLTRQSVSQALEYPGNSLIG